MGNERISMEPDAVESMQSNLNRGEPAIMTSYGMIGAIMLLGGAGLRLIDTSGRRLGVCWQA